MRFHRANALTISLLVQLTVKTVGSEPVSMYVRQEATSVNYLYVNFYNDTFKRLYDCMTDTDNGQCNIRIIYESSGRPLQGYNWKATSVTPLRSAHLDRSYFTCLYDQRTDAVQCTRYNTSQCGKDKCDSFRLQGSSICDNQCVHLMWAYSDEKLLLNSTTDRFEYCDQMCTTTTVYISTVNSTEHISLPSVTSRLSSEQTSDATTNSSSAAVIANTGSRNSSDTQLPIIIGVVCSLVVIIIVIIVVGIMYRRRKLNKRHASPGLRPSHRDANYRPSHTDANYRPSHTDANYRPSHTDANYNGGLAAQPSIAPSTMSDIPAVATLPHSGHLSATSPESDAGYYTLDEDYERRRYENVLSSGTSHIYEGDTLISSPELNDYQNVLSSSSQFY